MILGIDCGVTGALALIDMEGRLSTVTDMPAVDKAVAPALLADWLCEVEDEYGRNTLAVVERLHAMPPPIGSKANFSKGHSYGVVLGALATLRCPIEAPTPAAWKKAIGVTSDKETARKKALDLWPAWSETFRLKKHADRAEAALLAEWGRRLLVERGQAA